MDGELQDASVATICRHVSAEGRSGTLTVSGLDGPGSISFADGRIVAARSPVAGARLGDRLVGAGFLSEPDLRRVLDDQQREGSRARLGALLVERRLVTRDAIRLFLQEQTLDSLLELVRWRFGTYRFEDADPAADSDQTAVPVAMPVDDVLLVVGQRQREWMELSRVIPDLAAVPTFTAATTTVSATLEPDEFAVLASVDGERDLHQLAEDLGYHEFELARIVYGLTQLGVVDVLLPEDEVGAALDAALHPDHAPPPAATVRASLAERWRAEGPDGAVDAPAAAQEPADSEPGDAEPGDAEPADSEPGDAEPGDAEPREAPAAAPEPEPVAAAPVAPAPDPEPTAPESEPEPDIHEPGPDPTPVEPEAPTPDPAVHAAQPTAPEPERPAPQPTAHEAEQPAPAPEPTPHEPEQPAPAPAPAPQEPEPGPEPAPPAAAPQEPEPGPEPDEDPEPARPAASGGNDADVSEFLRELSRLSEDDAPSSPGPRSRRTPSPTDDDKPRRRGLFGRS